MLASGLKYNYFFLEKIHVGYSFVGILEPDLTLQEKKSDPNPTKIPRPETLIWPGI